MLKQAMFYATLKALPVLIGRAAANSPSFKQDLARHNCVYQIKLKDNSAGRYYRFENGKVTSKRGVHPNPDAAMVFKNLEIAGKMLSPSPDMRSEDTRLNSSHPSRSRMPSSA